MGSLVCYSSIRNSSHSVFDTMMGYSFNTCSYWRNVAISCPEIWSVIPVRSERATAEFLKRARVIDIRDSFHAPMTMALHDMSRIRTLKIHFFDSLPLLATLPKLRFPAPILESIQISGYVRSAALPMMATLFRKITPKLVILTLSGFNLSEYDFSAIVRLKELKIRDCRIPQDQIWNLLRQSPSIEVLLLSENETELLNATHSAVSLPTQISQLSLPNLHDFSFTGTMQHGHDLASTLAMSQEVKIAYKIVKTKDRSRIEPTAFLRAFSNHINRIQAIRVAHHLTISGNQTSFNIIHEPSDTPPIHLGLHIGDDLDDNNKIFEILGLFSIHKLSLVESTIPLITLRMLANVTHLEFVSVHPEIQNRVYLVIQSLASKNESDIILPNLETLSLLGFNFQKQKQEQVQNNSFYEILTTALSERMQRGAKLNMLEIKRPTAITERFLSVLKTMTTAVEWDGKGAVTYEVIGLRRGAQKGG